MSDERFGDGASSGDGADERPVDFSALDPANEGTHFESRIAAIQRASRGELLRRSQRTRRRARSLGVIELLLGWRRPILAGSLLLALASGAALVTVRTSASTQSSLAESLGVPTEWTSWLGSNDGTSVDPMPRSTDQGSDPRGASGGGR
ncbi:MAG: hypothetical protein U0527_09050 [Candidatus Eisenbacteria bacterium]